MARRRFRLLGAVAAVAAGLALFHLLSPSGPSSAINRANFDLIREGMTQEEVEGIFGCPPGQYNRRPVTFCTSGVMFRRWWVSDDAVVTVEMTPDDDADPNSPWRVSRKEYRDPRPESLAERFECLLADLW